MSGSVSRLADMGDLGEDADRYALCIVVLSHDPKRPGSTRCRLATVSCIAKDAPAASDLLAAIHRVAADQDHINGRGLLSVREAQVMGCLVKGGGACAGI